MYEILFSPTAKRQLLNLEKIVQKRVIAALERIRIRPENYLKKLVDDPGYRLKVGEWRIIIDIDRGRLLILVIKIGHRRNIYKNPFR